MVLRVLPLMRSKQANQQYIPTIGKSIDGIVIMPKAAIDETSVAPARDGFFVVDAPTMVRANVRKTRSVYPLALVENNTKNGNTETEIDANIPDKFSVRHRQKTSGIKPIPAKNAGNLIDAG